jgi:hypothetical protein
MKAKIAHIGVANRVPDNVPKPYTTKRTDFPKVFLLEDSMARFKEGQKT